MKRRIRIAAAVLSVSALLGAPTALAASSDPGFSKRTAIPIPLDVGTASVDSTGSTASDARTHCGDATNTHVVWFKATAPQTQLMSANTVGSNEDTVLDVYQGGKFIGCNDDIDPLTNHQSSVTFDAIAGRTYFFKVARFDNGGGGLVVLNLLG